MLSRLLHSTPASTSRRTYSFFSSKPGGGRSFNPNKPPKVAVGKPSDPSSSAPHNATGSPSNSPERPSQGPNSADIKPLSSALSPVADSSSPMTPSATARPTASFSALPSLRSIHPQPGLNALHLHEFFSLDRPLLLLSQPLSTLFESTPQAPPPSMTPPASATEESSDGLIDDPEGDVDVARLLARSIVVHRVGSVVDWSDVMKELGAPSDISIQLDSVKRKRRKKMNKHR